MQFVLDADVFIQSYRLYYAFDLAPKFWGKLITHFSSGNIGSIDHVRNELFAGNDALATWVKANATGKFEQTTDPDITRAYRDIMQWAMTNTQYTEQATMELAAAADGDAVTLAGNFAANMAYRKNAIHLITRAPAMPVGPDGRPMDSAEDVIELTDPFTGITFQVAVYKQFRQVLFYVGLAWGVANVKTEHSVLLLG